MAKNKILLKERRFNNEKKQVRGDLLLKFSGSYRLWLQDDRM